MLEFSKENLNICQNLIDTQTVLLEFYANWCGTCRSVSRMLHHVDSLNVLKIIRIDIDQHKDFMKKYEILGVPVILLLNQGKEVIRLGGSINFEEFKNWIHQVEEFKELS